MGNAVDTALVLVSAGLVAPARRRDPQSEDSRPRVVGSDHHLRRTMVSGSGILAMGPSQHDLLAGRSHFHVPPRTGRSIRVKGPWFRPVRMRMMVGGAERRPLLRRSTRPSLCAVPSTAGAFSSSNGEGEL